MSRDYTPHQWADHYNRHATSAQRDADNHKAAAQEAERIGQQARANYLHSEALMHQRIADKYAECARRSERLAERMDEQRRTFGRTMREGWQ